jgi:hypothetical protein
MGEQTEFWTMTETERTDVYTKRFYYNKANIVQIAESPYALCSVRLVKDYDGTNFRGVETINGQNYQTVLMPSEKSENGYSIWIASNVAFDYSRYNPVTPDYESEINDNTAYYINEWNGFSWVKKRLEEGDSLVIKVGPDGNNNHEYRLIDGKLINIKNDLKEELNDIVAELNQNIIDLTDNVAELTATDEALRKDLIDNVAELTATDEALRKDLIDNVAELTAKDVELTATDEALHKDLTDNVAELTATDEALRKDLIDNVAELTATDEALRKDLIDNVAELTATDEALRKDLIDNVAELTGRLISQEGSSYDCANGVITLTTDNPSNTIIIHLTSDYGTF